MIIKEPAVRNTQGVYREGIMSSKAWREYIFTNDGERSIRLGYTLLSEVSVAF